jgi:serine/threonine protein kinase
MFLMEYCSQNLKEIVKSYGVLCEEQVKICSAQVIAALHYIHLRGIAYRNLKPENVIVDGHGNSKLVDFHLSKKIVI